MLWSNWSFRVHALGDIAEIAWASEHQNVAEDGILWSGCSHEDSQLQSDNSCQQGLYAWLRGVDLPGDLPIWALIVNIQNCHSDQLADLQGVDIPGDLLNFWQDRVDPTSTWNMQFLDTKCSPVGVDFKYVFSFALCKGYDFIHKWNDTLAHQF